VALTVDPTNEPAVRAYLRLGYAEETRLIESQVRRRSAFGIRPALGAMLAAWRGRREGGEIVSRRT
jgi:RimJ/RimL family protein N-acetyltransferase